MEIEFEEGFYYASGEAKYQYDTNGKWVLIEETDAIKQSKDEGTQETRQSCQT